MRFIENGPNIPDELLLAQDEGQVVLFCGAGVSMAHAKLSSFIGLADKVMHDLGATEESKAKQQLSELQKLNEKPNTRGLVSADHIFSSLRRSFDQEDINRSVAQSLFPQISPNLKAHETILKLARLIDGQTRLITTNFDLLFEACDENLNSATRSNLPHIESSDNNWGVVHLHGKVKPDYSGPDRDGFVLSSSEFGDAYLAQGWARNFIKEVLGKYISVFIGYKADDPPIKYLLEGLQQGNGFKHKIYAFQSGPDDEAVAQWHEKGVEPIIYKLDSEQKHNLLWDTLEEWAGRSQNPEEWKKKILSKGLKGPTRLKPHERGMIAHLVNSQSGAKAFEQMDPPMPSEWLCVFDSTIRLKQSESELNLYSKVKIIYPYQLYSLDDDKPPPSGRNEEYQQSPEEFWSKVWDAFKLNQRDRENLDNNNLPQLRGHRANHLSNLPVRLSSIARWIAKVSNQTIAVWWAGQQPFLHPEVLRYIQWELTRDKEKQLHNVIAKAWNNVFELSYFNDRDDHEEHELGSRIKLSGWSNFIVREYTRISAPILKLDSLHNRLIPRDKRRKISVRDLINIKIDYPKGIYKLKIPDEYLAPIIYSLRLNIEKAYEMKAEFSYWGDFCSIEPDEDVGEDKYHREYGISGYILHFVKLFGRLLEVDKEKAKTEYSHWSNTNPIFVRLRVWVSGLKDFTTETEFANEIVSLKKNDFWPFKGNRDLLLTLKNRWSELSLENKVLIENKILEGPPKAQNISLEKFQERSAFNQLSRLHWLKSQGCRFNMDFNETTKRLKKLAPGWKQKYSRYTAESHDGRGGSVKTDTDSTSLQSLPISKIIKYAEKKERHDYRLLTDYDPFAGLSDDDPEKALGALYWNSRRGKFYSKYWETYFSREKRKNEKFRLKLLAAEKIIKVPNKNLIKILHTITRWFEDVGSELKKKNKKIFEAVWGKFIKLISKHENLSGSNIVRQNGDEIDWANEAINSPSGNLAELLMKDPAIKDLKSKKGLPRLWLLKANQLLQLPNNAHRYAIVIFTRDLSWFFAIDSKWTEHNLLNIIEDEAYDKYDKEAFWAGFMWGASQPIAQLYNKLKPHLLRMASESNLERKKHLEVLSGILLSGWRSRDSKNQPYVTDNELHNVLLKADDDFRSQLLWQFERWNSEDTDKNFKEILNFLQNVWPKHRKVRTSKSSARLCDIALSQPKNFPIISKLVCELVSKVGDESIYLPEMRRSGENIATDHPEAFLNLLFAILPEQPARWPYGAGNALKSIEKSDPELLRNHKLIELKSRLNDL